MERLLSRKHIKHAVAAVESLDGAFASSAAVGEARPNGTPMQSETPFMIASVTKLYIASVILRFHERDLLSLEEPISAYLTGDLIAGLHRVNGVDHTGAITVRHLLGHTSGLPDYIEERPKGGRALIDRVVTDGDMAWTLDEVVDIVRKLPPHFPPQQLEGSRPRARYSDTNYRLLMAIIEDVSGEPVARVFERELYRPLKLRHTHHPGQASLEPVPESASLYFKDRPLQIPLALRSFGDLHSTVADMLRFLRALVRGEIYEDPATASLMQHRWIRFGFPRDRAALRTPGWPIEYGLGMMRFHIGRLFAPGRRPVTLVGHSGSTGSWLFHCPELDLMSAGTVDQATAGPVPFRVQPRILRAAASAVRSDD
jgi:CubicO group peptidase (beta-lactamase class C family)